MFESVAISVVAIVTLVLGVLVGRSLSSKNVSPTGPNNCLMILFIKPMFAGRLSAIYLRYISANVTGNKRRKLVEDSSIAMTVPCYSAGPFPVRAMR